MHVIVAIKKNKLIDIFGFKTTLLNCDLTQADELSEAL